MLDSIVQSPIAVVQYNDSDVDLRLPGIEQHPYGFVKGTNDCGRGAGYSDQFYFE
jgi:hypothetical protein